MKLLRTPLIVVFLMVIGSLIFPGSGANSPQKPPGPKNPPNYAITQDYG